MASASLAGGPWVLGSGTVTGQAPHVARVCDAWATAMCASAYCRRPADIHPSTCTCDKHVCCGTLASSGLQAASTRAAWLMPALHVCICVRGSKWWLGGTEGGGADIQSIVAVRLHHRVSRLLTCCTAKFSSSV